MSPNLLDATCMGDGVYYRNKIVALLQAVELFPKNASTPFDSATETLLTYAHAALAMYVLGIPDKNAPSLDIDNAQQFLLQQKLFKGPADSHWSVTFGSALQQAFSPLAGTKELSFIRRLMFGRQVQILTGAYQEAMVGLPAGALRAIGLRTDAFANSVKWRVILLDAALVSVYDTHAAIGENVPRIGIAYSARPEVIDAVKNGAGWSTRTGDEYGFNDMVNYMASRLTMSLPYAYVSFSRAAN